MKTDVVILGTLEPCFGHFHLEWTCPDCEDFWSLPDEYRPFRYRCVKTGRWLLVVVIDHDSPLAGRPFEPHSRYSPGAPRFVSPTPTTAEERIIDNGESNQRAVVVSDRERCP